MRIALLTDGIWPFVVGGMQKHSYYLCKYLTRKQVYVDLYLTTKDGLPVNISDYFSKEEVSFLSVYYIPYPQSDKYPGHYLRTSYKYSKNISEVLLKSLNVDLIYAKGLTSWHIIKLKRSGLKLPPICINVHGYEYYQHAPSFKGWLRQLLLRPPFHYINTHCDYIFSYGGRISDIIRKHIRNAEGRIIEIPTGIEFSFLRETKINLTAERQFIFIGRFESRKGINELFKAFDHVSAKYRAKLHIIGDIPSSKRPKSPGYSFYGELKDKERIKQLMQSSDVLLCPSYAEGMPNVILEGMASGCAIIASDVGAIPVLVTESNGWLIKGGSVKSLVEAMEDTFKIENDLLISMRLNSIKKVSDFYLWEVIIDRLIDSFNVIRTNKILSVKQND